MKKDPVGDNMEQIAALRDTLIAGLLSGQIQNAENNSVRKLR